MIQYFMNSFERVFHTDSKKKTTRKKITKQGRCVLWWIHDESVLPTLLLVFIHSFPSASNTITRPQSCPLPSYKCSLKTQLRSHFLKKKKNKLSLTSFSTPGPAELGPPICFQNTRNKTSTSASSLKMQRLSGKTTPPTELSALRKAMLPSSLCYF